MKQPLLFSIIIPTFNRAGLISKTIKSVLLQSYTNYEILIIDDGSTDNTEAVAKHFLAYNIRYYKIKNVERGAARNYGVIKSKGNYITFLDSDDLLYPTYLANANDSILKFKTCPFLHLAYEIKNSNGKIVYKNKAIKSDDLYFITKGNPLSCLGVFIRKDVIEKFPFNEDRDLSGSEDWELWLRIIANFGIKTDKRISASLIQHDQRSVLQFDEQKLYKRKELALKYAFMDEAVVNLYRKYYKKIDAYADGYISLHLALAHQKDKSIRYLLKSIKNYPLVIFSKRFFAIIKHLIISIKNKN